VTVATGETEVNWRKFLESLSARGLCGVRLIVSDAHSGLKKAVARSFPGVPWNRCQFHLQQNLMSKVTSLDKKKMVAEEVRSILKAPDINQVNENLAKVVRKYRGKDDILADWIEGNVPEGLTVLRLGWPAHHQRRLRTNNMLERIYKEVRRRTKVVSIFPNASSLLRLVSAIFMEVDEDWQNQKVYLEMKDLMS
jgi:transposase-like protein